MLREATGARLGLHSRENARFPERHNMLSSRTYVRDCFYPQDPYQDFLSSRSSARMAIAPGIPPCGSFTYAQNRQEWQQKAARSQNAPYRTAW
jgi:hypothetical protein